MGFSESNTRQLSMALRRIREEAGQLSWFAKEYRNPRRWLIQARVNIGLKLPKLKSAFRVPGSVWAVGMVRNEEDIIGHAIRHLLDQGVDHILVADNLSTDGTPDVLAQLARQDPRVHVVRDLVDAFYQSEKTSRLARVAWWCGADWVIPFDADEFWFARGKTLKQFFARRQGGIVYANFHHMVTVATDYESLNDASFILDAKPSFPGKVAVRSHPLVVLRDGNHDAMRVGGVVPSRLYVAHAKYRSPQQIARKFRQGNNSVMLINPAENIAPHWRKGAEFSDEEIQEIWDTISGGLPDPRIDHDAHGPMVKVIPLRWRTWDPAGEVPDTAAWTV